MSQNAFGNHLHLNVMYKRVCYCIRIEKRNAFLMFKTKQDSDMVKAKTMKNNKHIMENMYVFLLQKCKQMIIHK